MRKAFYSIWESRSENVEHIVQQETDKSEVDGVHILARVVGPAFFPGTTSRNNVHYPLEAWENAINDPEFQERLANRLVFGTIGHDPEMTDNEVRDGIHSHIVTKVWIDENNIGMAEYLILNTEPGKVLNTLLRAKCKISVSTRAYGATESENTPSGAEVVDPNDFTLERIDFVIDPGYKQAKPILQEQNKTNKQIKQEENVMGDVNVITEHLEKQLTKLQEAYNLSSADTKKLQEALTEAKITEAKNQAELDAYRTVGGAVKDLTEAMKLLEQYKNLGDVKAIKESLEDGTETIEQLTEEIETLQAKKAELEAQLAENEQAGTATSDELEKAKTQLQEYDEIGTAEELRSLIDTATEVQEELDQYRALGTPEEIKATFEKVEQFAEENEQAELAELANEYGVDPEAVTLLKGKGLEIEEIETILDKVVPELEGDPNVDISEDGEGDNEGNGEEDDEENQTFGESMSSTMLRRLSRMKRVRESKGKSANAKTAGKKSYKEAKVSTNNALLAKLIKA